MLHDYYLKRVLILQTVAWLPRNGNPTRERGMRSRRRLSAIHPSLTLRATIMTAELKHVSD